MTFLDDIELRPLEIGDGRAFHPVGLALGKGAQPVEVAVLAADRRPSVSDLRALWKARLKGRATPLLVVALYDGRAAICGPAGDQPPAYTDLDPDLVERICRAALEEPDRHAALRRLHAAIPNVQASLAGLRNEGLFATHELEHDVRRRPDWPDANSRATALLKERGEALLRALGFSVEPLTAGPGSILRAAGTRTALAIFLGRNESPETPSLRFSDHSPITWALNVADQERLRYVIVCNGAQVRLYLTELRGGAGRTPPRTGVPGRDSAAGQSAARRTRIGASQRGAACRNLSDGAAPAVPAALRRLRRGPRSSPVPHQWAVRAAITEA